MGAWLTDHVTVREMTNTVRNRN